MMTQETMKKMKELWIKYTGIRKIRFVYIHGLPQFPSKHVTHCIKLWKFRLERRQQDVDNRRGIWYKFIKENDFSYTLLIGKTINP